MSEGFANHETFTVAVTLENDRPHAERVKQIVADCLGHERGDLELADRLRDYVEGLGPIDDAGDPGPRVHWGGGDQDEKEALRKGAALLRGALCTAALGRVDWLDLAEHWRRRYTEDVAPVVCGRPWSGGDTGDRHQ